LLLQTKFVLSQIMSGLELRTLQIHVLPTIIAFKDGKAVDQFEGAIPDEAIKEFIARQ
jgi:thioredoxin-like negative regulator of GroEL